MFDADPTAMNDQSFVPPMLSVKTGHGTATKDEFWLDENIPCRSACPAKTDIPGYLEAIYRGDHDEAYRINLRDNVFPAILGRVCSRPCEDACRHGWEGLGDSVAICFSKRSAGDFNTSERVVLDPIFPSSGKRVAIIGSGPAGLAAARNLALLGHTCTVFEKHERPGGMLNQGIPEFRLPRDIIEREIDQVRQQGVDIRCGVTIGEDITLEALLADHDAVIMAAGTLRPNMLSMSGDEAQGVAHGLPWLLDANEHHNAIIGKSVLVIGGGFTAMDCARTAERLQRETVSSEETSVRVCYRRSQNEMLVTPGEVEELENESIPMEFMVSPQAYDVSDDDAVKGMHFTRTTLGEPDDSGRRRPLPVPGSAFTHPADTVLLATGQFPDTSWIDEALRPDLVNTEQWVKSETSHDTAIPKLFVAGDFSTGATTLIDAIGHAKTTARNVDAFLMGEVRLIDTALVADSRTAPRARKLDAIERVDMPTLPILSRAFAAEVETGYEADASVTEASRCYLCHYKYEIDNSRCIKCDQCIQVMPRPNCISRINALTTDADGIVTGIEEQKGAIDYNAEYFINQAECIRCNACLEVCPTECITVQKVSGCVKAVTPPDQDAYL
ncbi:MAG: glutamate synthase (NADPH/NADH) small chain [Candidatus Promineifilaceae bacterium]|jgi:glutamate synthase (NADPH/NADH) small chain